MTGLKGGRTEHRSNQVSAVVAPSEPYAKAVSALDRERTKLGRKGSR